MIDAFFAAARAGDLAALVELLDPDVVLRTDGFAGGADGTAGRRRRVRCCRGGASPHAELHHVLINGAAGVLITLRGRPAALMAFTVAAAASSRSTASPTRTGCAASSANSAARPPKCSDPSAAARVRRPERRPAAATLR